MPGTVPGSQHTVIISDDQPSYMTYVHAMSATHECIECHSKSLKGSGGCTEIKSRHNANIQHNWTTGSCSLGATPNHWVCAAHSTRTGMQPLSCNLCYCYKVQNLAQILLVEPARLMGNTSCTRQTRAPRAQQQCRWLPGYSSAQVDLVALGISRMGEVAGGACWKVWGCLWRMCGWMGLKLCGNVIEIHGKALQVLQGRSEPPRHSKEPSQPSSHPPSPTTVRDMSRSHKAHAATLFHGAEDHAIMQL